MRTGRRLTLMSWAKSCCTCLRLNTADVLLGSTTWRKGELMVVETLLATLQKTRYFEGYSEPASNRDGSELTAPVITPQSPLRILSAQLESPVSNSFDPRVNGPSPGQPLGFFRIYSSSGNGLQSALSLSVCLATVPHAVGSLPNRHRSPTQNGKAQRSLGSRPAWVNRPFGPVARNGKWTPAGPLLNIYSLLFCGSLKGLSDHALLISCPFRWQKR